MPLTIGTEHVTLVKGPELEKKENEAKSNKKMASRKKEEDKKTLWHSIFYGLTIGVISTIINILPEKIGKFLNRVFAGIVKTDNPYAPES
jgi:hypothetical protein